MGKSSLFSTTGIRGLANKDITPERAVEFGKTFGTFLKGSATVLVGRDSRTSSCLLKQALNSGLMATGVHVIDGSLLPIPALGYLVSKNYDAGIMVTSSHNPPEYNGFKFILGNGLEITDEDEDAFEEIYNSKKYTIAPWDALGSYTKKTGTEEYIDALKSLVNIDAIKKAELKVAIDTGNGAQSILVPQIIKALGCELIEINSEPKGVFDRSPEPTPDTLGEFTQLIKDNDADIGIAYDIDGDRAIFADETGKVLMGDVSGTLLARELYKEQKGPIVTTVATSKIIDDVLADLNTEPIKTRVGGKHVAKALLDQNGVFGFEEGGGCIFTKFNLTRDADAATVKMLEILAQSGKKFSQLIAEMPYYYQCKTKIECTDDAKEKSMKAVSQSVGEDKAIKELITLDGVKALYEDGSVLIRASGTEPIIRVFSEATSENRAQELLAWGVKQVKNTL